MINMFNLECVCVCASVTNHLLCTHTYIYLVKYFGLIYNNNSKQPGKFPQMLAIYSPKERGWALNW